MPQQSFSATIDDWVAETKQRLEAVFKESAQRVIAIAQTPVGAGGNMPIRTGFLRASIRGSLSQMPMIDLKSRPVEGQVYAAGSEIVLVIASARLGQTVYVGYTAGYAGHQEIKRGFVRLAAMQWPNVVSQVCAELKGRATVAVPH